MDDSTSSVVVGFNKKSLSYMLLGAAIFVVAGVFIWMSADNPDISPGRQLAYRIFGGAATILFGLAFVVILAKRFNRQVALVIDDQGLIDQASPMKAGRIPWDDIEGFEIAPAAGQTWFVVRLTRPEDYLQRVSKWRRHVGAANQRMVGSPVVISPNILDADIDELCMMLAARLEERRDASDEGPDN